MSRITQLQSSRLSGRQREIYDRVIQSRGSITGPFRAWLHSPELADRAQHLGAFVRYDTSLEPRLSELAILATARFWDCQLEWSLHEKIARESGLCDAVVEAVRDHRDPPFDREDERSVYTFTLGMHRQHFVSDELLEAVRSHLGDTGTVELTGILGHYTLVAMTLNSFQIPMPVDVSPLLPDCSTFV